MENINLDATFWFGGIIGAVLGTLLALLSRPLERYLDRRFEDRTTLRSRELAAKLSDDRAALRDFLTLQVLETTFIVALVGIIAGVLFAIGTIGGFGQQLIFLGQLVSVTGGIMVVRIAGDAIRIGRKLKVWH